jgi:hypothetical protein
VNSLSSSAPAVGEALGGLLVATGFERIGAIILIAFLAVVSARYRDAARQLFAASASVMSWGIAAPVAQAKSSWPRAWCDSMATRAL